MTLGISSTNSGIMSGDQLQVIAGTQSYLEYGELSILPTLIDGPARLRVIEAWKLRSDSPPVLLRRVSGTTDRGPPQP